MRDVSSYTNKVSWACLLLKIEICYIRGTWDMLVYACSLWYVNASCISESVTDLQFLMLHAILLFLRLARVCFFVLSVQILELQECTRWLKKMKNTVWIKLFWTGSLFTNDSLLGHLVFCQASYRRSGRSQTYLGS